MSKDNIRYLYGTITIPADEVERLSKMTIEEFMKEYLDKKIKEEYRCWIARADELLFNDGTGKLGEEKDE